MKQKGERKREKEKQKKKLTHFPIYVLSLCFMEEDIFANMACLRLQLHPSHVKDFHAVMTLHNSQFFR